MSPRKKSDTGVRAAIFARKSTKDDARDEEKSVARQQQLAREFAESKGFTVVETYTDNISGQHSKRLVERGKMLMAAAEGQFAAVIVRDADRLSRDDKEIDPVVILAGYGVQVWEYVKGAVVDVGDATNRLVRSIHRFKGSKEAEDASQRTREQKLAKAKIASEHGIADGKVLGYRNVGEHKARRREIDPEQAKLVTRIFEMSAAGLGYLKIATTLNSERVKNPSGQDRRDTLKRSDQWSVSGIKSVLARELYRGKVAYGKKRNVHTEDGRKKVDGDKLVTVHRPELAIIPETLWTAAHARMASARRQYLRATNGRLYGKPGAGVEGKHLLSGLLECGVCGGNMFISKKSGKRGRPMTVFACSNRRAGRGAPDGSPCSNLHGVPEPELIAGVVAELKNVLLQPMELVKALAAEIERRQQQPDELKARRQEQNTKVARLSGEVGRLAEAIATGGGSSKTLVQKLADREAELRDARANLEHLDGLAVEAKEVDEVELLEEMVATVKALKDNLSGDPAAGRQTLKRLLQSPIVITPDDEDSWSFKFKASFLEAPLDLASPGGTVPVSQVEREFTGTVTRRASKVCPRGDSNTRHAV